jgi:hypothetical protein
LIVILMYVYYDLYGVLCRNNKKSMETGLTT